VLDLISRQHERDGSRPGSRAGLRVWRVRGSHGERSRIDPSYIVIDEVVGQLLCLLIVSLCFELRIKEAVASFVFFRIFDIFKPCPIMQIERTLEQNPKFRTLSIVLDDVFAGIFGGCFTVVLLKLFVNPT
jgi:phosphatidylglycerophosphatase A